MSATSVVVPPAVHRLPAGPALPLPMPESVPSGPPPSARSRPRPPSSTPREELRLPTEGTLFPWLARRFAPGEATVWMGPSAAIDRILHLVYAGSAAMGGRISLIEGANRFDPYHIAEGGRPLGLDPARVLEGIRLARAFTAYQLVALVDGWAAEARRYRPTLLVGHELPLLFESSEVPEEEREPLLTHVSETLRELSARCGAPLLLTVPGGPMRFPGLAHAGPRLNDVVNFQPRDDRLTLTAYREASECLLLPRPRGQHGLEEFGPIVDGEVMAWDAPPRRTGRRSRNA